MQVSIKVRLTKYGTLIYTSPNNIVLLLVPHHYLIFLALCTVYFNLDNYTYGATFAHLESMYESFCHLIRTR